MIKFICKDVNPEVLKNAIQNALIDCAAETIWPINDDYDRTGLDYSNCKSVKEKRRLFAENFLGEIDFDILENGVVLNDDLYVEGAANEEPYDIEKFINNVIKEFPSAEVSGAGEIDYGYSISEYEIINDKGKIRVVTDEDEEYEEDDED